MKICSPGVLQGLRGGLFLRGGVQWFGLRVVWRALAPGVKISAQHWKRSAGVKVRGRSPAFDLVRVHFAIKAVCFAVFPSHCRGFLSALLAFMAQGIGCRRSRGLRSSWRYYNIFLAAFWRLLYPAPGVACAASLRGCYPFKGGAARRKSVIVFGSVGAGYDQNVWRRCQAVFCHLWGLLAFLPRFFGGAVCWLGRVSPGRCGALCGLFGRRAV